VTRTALVSASACVLLVLAAALLAAPFAAPSPDPVRDLVAPSSLRVGGSAEISATVTRTSSVTVEVRRAGRLVRRLVDDVPTRPGIVRAGWNGRDGRDRPVRPGQYEIRMTAYPGLRSFRVSRTIEVTL
jgi:hypothetical protein